MEAASIESLWEFLADSARITIEKYQKQCFRRKRRLDCFTVVLLVLRMVASKNSQGYSTTIAEFWEIAKSHIPRLRGTKPVASSTFCDARSKLNSSIFKDLNSQFIRKNEEHNQKKFLWEGHRLFCIDGTRINLPRELLTEDFKLPNPTSHYPIGLVSCLFQIKSKLPYDFEFENHLNERQCAHNHIKKLLRSDLIVYDRGYFSYALLEEHERLGVHAVFRLQDVNTFKAIEEFSKSQISDQVVEIIPTKRSIESIKKIHKEIEIRPIKFRLIKYQIDGHEYYIGTTLIDFNRYPEAIFPDLYHSRWGVEELYKISKKIINVEDFHSKNEEKVRQEVYAHFFLITLGRIFSNDAETEINRMDPAPVDLEKNESTLSKKKTANSHGKLILRPAYQSSSEISKHFL